MADETEQQLTPEIERMEADLYDAGRLEGLDDELKPALICNRCPASATVRLDSDFLCWTHFTQARDAMIAAHNPLED